MAYDGWLDFNGSELVNLSRTAQLAETLGIDVLWITPESVAWIETALSGGDYGDITDAPWYDSGFPASAEFAGCVPLALTGLDDSTLEATVTEYITDGGNSNKPRNKTLPIVANFAIIASTDRGAEFGKRWLDRRLKGGTNRAMCTGVPLHYFRYAQQAGQPVPPIAHRRDVAVTRSTSVTRKRTNDCSAVWWVTFTLTANDPFEYGEPIPQFTLLGGAVTGPGVQSTSSLNMTQQSCPAYNYAPIYDPLFPALVAPPTIPDFYPSGWDMVDGESFTRYWVRTKPTEPSDLLLVPMVTFTTSGANEARMFRLSIWAADENNNVQCNPLFSTVVTYKPPSIPMIIDGEQQASYVWDGLSPIVRRADSLVYGPDASPVVWSAFNDPAGLFVALDVFDTAAGASVRAALSLVPKSD